MRKLVILRHGQSQWNLENRFTGWTDVDLTDEGWKEAKKAGHLLKEEGFTFDIAYTSLLKRAIRTLWIVQDEMDLMWIPVERSWRLNERHYGALQGLNKQETAAIHSEEQVHIWRRSYDIPPPPLSEDDSRHPRFEARYHDLSPQELPATESLKLTIDRFLPYWTEVIAPEVKANRRVLIVAHGNSLRALVKHLEGLSDEEIVSLNIPTGIPFVYDLDENLRPTAKRYLGDPDEAEKAAQAVANQGKK